MYLQVGKSNDITVKLIQMTQVKNVEVVTNFNCKPIVTKFT